MKTINRIDLSQPGDYTTGVIHYADDHPEVRFFYTAVYDAYGRFCMMVSEYQPTDTDKEWHDLPNGWQREQTIKGVWVCRKGDRYIIITT